MIIKNQYLLAALVVLGVFQLWALGCLERASSGVENRLEEKHVKDTTMLAKEAVELKRQLYDARGQIEQIQSELRNTQNLLNQTRTELETVKKAAATKDAANEDKETRRQGDKEKEDPDFASFSPFLPFSLFPCLKFAGDEERKR